ncbi:MAG: 4-vinyl reductase [Planctomycetota bacterium]|nr:MAG: 4-vinyl reductase [Planctomycetota bacterium]
MSAAPEGLSFEPGRIALRGVRFLLVRPETLVGFQKAVEGEAGDVAKRCLMAGGTDGGGRSARRLCDGGLKGREVVEAMCRMGTEIGWGRFRVEKYGDAGFEIAIEASPYAEAYGPSQKPVCHFLAGVARGIGEAVYGAAVAAEVACASAGAPACRFEVKKS